MANEEHVAILNAGTETWNRWRIEHPFVIPDLSEATLRTLRLRGGDLRGAMLRWADLSRADLRGADLTEAVLREADLSETYLERATLKHADMAWTNLNSTVLRGADLQFADLTRAILNDADIAGAKFGGVQLGWTVFGNVSLRFVDGLDEVIHRGPSSIGIDTLYKSAGTVPTSFLLGAGLTNVFIEYSKSLVSNPVQFFSCFISYSSEDHQFAERLHADLQGNGVRCWFAPHDLKIGDRFRERIDESIRIYDKLLIVLSVNSTRSAWVETELEAAIEQERERGSSVLFPIRLDNSVLEGGPAWTADLRRKRHIGDFTKWVDENSYQPAFARLLRDLKP